MDDVYCDPYSWKKQHKTKNWKLDDFSAFYILKLEEADKLMNFSGPDH